MIWREFIIKSFLAIDFGTTQTSVALLSEGSIHEPEIVQIRDSSQKTEKAIPTALQLDEDGNVLYFGAKALDKSYEAPERTFQNFKVFVGKNPKEYHRKTEQNIYTPGDLALLYLTKLRETIEEHTFNGVKLSDIKGLTCIVGCPSDFNEVQKRILKNIVGKAGFPNPKLCDEPIGAIYYNYFFGDLKLKPSSSQNVLVYDLGGGTTDVAVAKVEVSGNGKIEPSVLSVSGLPDLGGRNFDETIADYYVKENNYDLSSLTVKDRLHDQWVINQAARQAKEDLLSKTSVAKIINHLKVINGLKPNKLSLSREQFNQICAGLMEQFDDPIYDALTLADLSVDDIDVVILAGGSSAMFFVQEHIRKIFSSSKTKILFSNGVEIIAQGLAIYGRAEASKPNRNDDIKDKPDYVYHEPRFMKSESETRTTREPQYDESLKDEKNVAKKSGVLGKTTVGAVAGAAVGAAGAVGATIATGTATTAGVLGGGAIFSALTGAVTGAVTVAAAPAIAAGAGVGLAIGAAAGLVSGIRKWRKNKGKNESSKRGGKR